MCLCVRPCAGTQIRPYEVTAAITAFMPTHTHPAARALCSVGSCAFGGPRRRTWRSCSGNRWSRVPDSALGVLAVQLGFEQIHGLEEGLLLGGCELVQDAGQRLGGAVQPSGDLGGLGGGNLDDRAPPVGRVGVSFDA